MEKYLKDRSIIIENSIKNELSEINYPTVLKEGISYALLNGGKRLRPILLLMTLELFEINIELGLQYAVAIECIHNYSLVHDDLPALDNDTYRRGQLTVHKKFGEAEAILIGDALLTHAFHILAKEHRDISHNQMIKILQKVTEAAGINGMIGGQFIDVTSGDKKVDLSTLQYIHINKTGKMMKLPIEIGLILANAKQDDIDTMIKFAELLGISFQIKDDILDVEGNFKKLGKTIGKDKNQNKITYPALFGVNESKKILEDKISLAKELIIKKYGVKAEKFVSLCDYMMNRES